MINNTQIMHWFSVLPQWLSAFGTVGAVIVALFRKPIRDRLNKPKIEMSYHDNKQCEVEINSSDSSDLSKEIHIRIKYANAWNWIKTNDNPIL